MCVRIFLYFGLKFNLSKIDFLLKIAKPYENTAWFLVSFSPKCPVFGLLRIVSTIQCILRVTSISGLFPRVGSQYRTTFSTKTFKRKCQGAVRWHQKSQNRFHQNGKGQIAHSAFITVIGKIKLIHSITIFIFYIKSFWFIFLTKMILWKIWEW